MTHLIIAGHGKQRNGSFDPGASGFITKGEHRYVSEDLFPAMRKYLPSGHNVVFFDKYKVSNYGNIVALAKEYNAKQITEIHFDAATPTARRGHVIVHSNFSPDKTDLALRDAIKKMVGVRYSHKGHEGISGRNNLFNVNATAKAGITYRLLELGFGSNREDADIMVNRVDDYAKELVKAITGSIKEAPSDGSIGVATVKIDGLNLRKGPGVNHEFIRKLKKGDGYIVWKEENGWLNLGGDQWASWQNGVYMDWVK